MNDEKDFQLTEYTREDGDAAIINITLQQKILKQLKNMNNKLDALIIKP